jgi:hypothetical protein
MLLTVNASNVRSDRCFLVRSQRFLSNDCPLGDDLPGILSAPKAASPRVKFKHALGLSPDPPPVIISLNLVRAHFLLELVPLLYPSCPSRMFPSKSS